MVVYVVVARADVHEPLAVFSAQADAEAYVTRQNALEKARHPHPCRTFHAQPCEVDAIK